MTQLLAEAQITGHAIRVWVVNTQNLSPEIQRLSALARIARIPIATITETLTPASVSFQGWQTAQWDRLRARFGSGHRAMSASDPPARGPAVAPAFAVTPALAVEDLDVSIAGQHAAARCQPPRRPGRIRRRARPQRGGQVHSDENDSRSHSRRRGAASGCSARARAKPGAGSATSPSARALIARHGSAAATWSRLGLDGARWGLPLALTRRARARRRAERDRVSEVIARVGATAYAHRAIGDLSGGEQQRLLIAAALVRRPALLILDEPLDSLDLPNQAAVAALVGDIARSENVAVLLVAHDVNPLLAHLDRVVYLAQGRALCGAVA